MTNFKLEHWTQHEQTHWNTQTLTHTVFVFFNNSVQCVCECICTCCCVFPLHSAINKCCIVAQTQDKKLDILVLVSLFRLTVCARVAAGAHSACVHVYTCAFVHVCVLREMRGKKGRRKKKWGQVSIPWCNCSIPPLPSSFFSKLVARGNALIMRSDGHPIIFTSQTSKQHRARRVGTDSSQSVRGWISNKTRWPPNKRNKLALIHQVRVKLRLIWNQFTCNSSHFYLPGS